MHRAQQTWSNWRETIKEWLDKLRRLWDDTDDDQEQEDAVTSMSDAPECRPIKTVAGLMSWRPPPAQGACSPTSRQERFCAAPLPGNTRLPAASTPGRPKLLVCHDMQGGYKADRWVQGCTDPQAFNLWRWECVDIFCYFSHHMVTSPPPVWISAAHTHNTLVLGTLITEGAAGRHKCEQMLASLASAQQAAEQLASLAAYHGFDGWLINIENGLGSSCLHNLHHFLCHLRASLKQSCGPQAMLIWYDAVTVQGDLTWQNDLTPLNQPFFDACDAIYLNYSWEASTPAKVAALAGSRAADVFMGVDVWGRGTYGGGQDTCDVALAAAHASGVSAALFGVGWLYEAFPRPGLIPRTDTWWDKVSKVWPPRQQPALGTPTCFATSFCRGYGRAGRWCQGQLLRAGPWHNLSAQQPQPYPVFVQPSVPTQAQAGPGSMQLRLAGVEEQHSSGWTAGVQDQLGFSGGSCLSVCGCKAALHRGLVCCHLFHVDITLPTSGILLAFAAAPFTAAADVTPAVDGIQGMLQGQGAVADVELAVVAWVRTDSIVSRDVPDSQESPDSISTSVPMVLLPASTTLPSSVLAALPAVHCPAVPFPTRTAPAVAASGRCSPAGTSSSSGMQEAGRTGADLSWRTTRLHVQPGGLLPAGCVITGLGLVVWAAPGQASESTREQHQGGVIPSQRGLAHTLDHPPPLSPPPPSDAPRTGWLLGHLSLSAHAGDHKDVQPSELGLANVQHQWQTDMELVLSCDVSWQAARGPDGLAAHSSYHIWVRLLQTPQMPSVPHKAVRSLMPQRTIVSPGCTLTHDGTWLWVGQAHTCQHHVTASIPRPNLTQQAATGQVLMLEWCLEGVRRGDGLSPANLYRCSTYIEVPLVKADD